MRKFIPLAVSAALLVSMSPVQVAGGVAGHYAGHHAVVGAVGGCIAAHEYYKHKAAQQAKAQQQARAAQGAH